MRLTILESIFAGISILLIILLVGIWIYWKYKKVPYTRERFAFFGITSLCSVFFFIVPYLFGNNLLLELLNQVTTKFFNFSFTVGQPDLSDKILCFLFLFFVGYLVLRIFNNWNGKKSLRQFELEKLNDKSNFFRELNAYFNEKESLREFRPEIDEVSRFQIKEPEIESIAWHDQVFDLLTLSDNQIKINKNKDWYPKGLFYLSTYGKSNIPFAVFCSINEPTESKVKEFLSNSIKYFPKGTNYESIRFIVAVKNANYLKYTKIFNNCSVEFTNENVLLNEIVDFSNYFNFLREQFEDKEIIDGYKFTLQDVYTEPFCVLKHKSDQKDDFIEIRQIEEYIINWINDSKCKKHLAILGEYGQGKSVLSQRVSYLISNGIVHSERIPIIIELRGRFPKQYQNSLAFLSDWCSTYSINPKALLKLHYAGKLVIIFEGFDEMELVGDYEIRVDHFRKLWGFSTPNSKIIITGRPNFFLNENELKTLLRTNANYENLSYCEEIYIKRFTISQIENALRNSDSETKSDILSILKSQDSESSFLDLMSRPSSLFLTSIVWKERNISKYKNNINSALVIEEFLKHSYSRQETKGVKSPLSVHERAYFMQGIAIAMVLKNKYTNQISQNELKEIILKLFNDFPEEITKENIGDGNYNKKLQKRFDKKYNEESVLLDIRSCGILVRDLSTFDSFKFSHKSFLELLVSNFIVFSLINLNDNDRKIEKIIKNSITNTLDITPNNIMKSPDVLRFVAEQCARKIQIPDHFNSKEQVRYIFKTIYPLKRIGFEKAFNLMLYLGNDLKTGFFIMLNCIVLSLLFGFTLSNMVIRILENIIMSHSYKVVLNVTLDIMFSISFIYIYHRLFIRRNSPFQILTYALLNVSNIAINKGDFESIVFLNFKFDKGNLLLFYLICKELNLLSCLESHIPKKIFADLSNQEKFLNRFQNGNLQTDE